MHTHRVTILGLLVLIVVAAGASAAVTTGGMKGVVLDVDGNPVAGAKVVIVQINLGIRMEGSTNEKGRYAQMGLKVGPYQVTITAEGFEEAGAVIPVNLGRRTPFEVTLSAVQEAAGPTVSYKLGGEEVTPELAEILTKAQTARDEGRAADATGMLEKLLVDHPTMSGAYFMLAEVYRDGGQTDRALELMTKGLELQPGMARGHQVMGEMLAEKGRNDEAIACYRKAVELDPKLAVGYKKLGMALLNKADFAGAADALDRYVELEPTAADTAQMKVVAGEARKLCQK